MIDWNDILPAANGLWPDILKQVCGLPDTTFNRKHQPCPSCGGKDRFRWDDKLNHPGDGGAICGQCGSGDGMSWLLKLTGLSFPDAVQTVADFVGHIPVEQIAIKKKEIASRSSQNKYPHVDAHKEAMELIKKCGLIPVPDEFPKVVSRYGLFIDPMYIIRFGEHDFIANTVRNSAGKITNLMITDPDTGESDVATGGNEYHCFSWYCHSIIGKDTGKFIYLVSDWVDAHIVQQQTKSQVWICYQEMNINCVLNANKNNTRLMIACNRNDKDAINAASMHERKVVLPVNQTWKESLKAERKLHDPDQLLEGFENE